MPTKNNGICFLCKQEVAHRGIVKHLNKCLEIHGKKNEQENEKIFLISIYDAEKLFWLFVEINGSTKLKVLDFFLRKTWLECCGHMSEFTINGAKYSNDRELRSLIHKTFNIGDEFEYDYDFGSTTHLNAKIISNRLGKLPKEIHLLARNNLPIEIKCTTCGKHPEVICSSCYDFCCKKCKALHNGCEGEEFFLPVVNSPRMGVCGYTGED
ncbi:MAG: pRiA4b ORF-3-like protein [Francisellaceae bacterium]|nr:pRiA4b ORF-3-like protein [Francisellaceae bacterium]